MKDKLKTYVYDLFANETPTMPVVELREEILQNTMDRYDDLIAEGKSEEDAYNIAIAGIGNIDELLRELKETGSTVSERDAALYEKDRRRSALLLSIAVLLYICSVIPPIVLGELYDSEVAGPVLMLVMVGIATALIIYRANTKMKPPANGETVVQNFKEWNRANNGRREARKSISSAIWALTLVAYFVVSFSTGAWYISWVIFLIGGAVSNIVKAIFDLN